MYRGVCRAASRVARAAWRVAVAFTRHAGFGSAAIVAREAFDEGRIVEEGTHDVLMQKQGLYAKLFLTQAQHYQ